MYSNVKSTLINLLHYSLFSFEQNVKISNKNVFKIKREMWILIESRLLVFVVFPVKLNDFLTKKDKANITKNYFSCIFKNKMYQNSFRK